jgi:hypothetical protein
LGNAKEDYLKNYKLKSQGEKMGRVILLFVLFSVTAYAQNIYLKNGHLYYNAEIIWQDTQSVKFTLNNKSFNIKMINIESIAGKYNPMVISYEADYAPPRVITPDFKPAVKYPHRDLLIVGFLSGIISWDYFAQASDTHPGPVKTRKLIIGIGAAASAIAAVIISFDSVKVLTSPNTLMVSYNF